MDDLQFELHFDADLAADCSVLDGLQNAVGTLAFGDELRVFEYETDRRPLLVDASAPGALCRAVIEKGSRRGPTFDRLVKEESPSADGRRFGDATIRGKPAATSVTVSFDEYVPAMPIGDEYLFSNSVVGTSGSALLGRRPRHECVRSFVTEMAQLPGVLWGSACLGSQFSASNVHDDADGTWALGRDVRRSLPGLFWLNVFGERYLDVMDRDRVSVAPARVSTFPAAAIVELYDTPDLWDTPEGRERHRQVLEHLGAEYFFDRHDPSRQTTAPDFGLTPLPDRPRLQVFTSDGVHYTDLPQGRARP